MDIRKVKPRKIVAGYLIIQAVVTLAWWCLLLLQKDSIRLFQPEHWQPEVLLSFFIADFTFLILGSLVTTFAVLRQREWAVTAVWLMVGAGWYPALYCVGASVLTGSAWIASSLMVAMAGLMLAIATIYGTTNQSPSAIRVVPMRPAPAVLWTLFQILIFWSVFLWILPMGITELQRKIELLAFTHTFQFEGSMVVFLFASSIGIWSAWVMATCGSGTPLPTATAPKLVLVGPYRFVRNPMAVTGVVQGLAVGWMLGSWLVMLGAIVCGFAWHLLVRPVEEADLCQRFGEDYLQYQQRVGLWLPRFNSRK